MENILTELMKKVLITQSNYIPWKGYFDNIAQCDTFVIYDDMQYTRRDWRNRNHIKTPHGLKWLSIPVEVKGKYFQAINETVVSEPDWNLNHWKQLKHNYSKAPFFKANSNWIEEVYQTACFKTLTEINIHFLKAICLFLDIKTQFIDSREFNLVEGKTERLVSICKQLDATDYYTGSSAKDYMDEKLFLNQNINVHYFDYSNYAEYSQQNGEFCHYVTIFDLIFNTGKDAKNYMKSVIK